MQLQQLTQQRDNLDIEWGQLQLEQSAWSQQAFVENVASSRLRMSTPPAQQIKIVAP
jgi:cell division protein FtsL